MSPLICHLSVLSSPPFAPDLARTAGHNDSSNLSLLDLTEKKAQGGLARLLLQATQRLPPSSDFINVIPGSSVAKRSS